MKNFAEPNYPLPSTEARELVRGAYDLCLVGRELPDTSTGDGFWHRRWRGPRRRRPGLSGHCPAPTKDWAAPLVRADYRLPDRGRHHRSVWREHAWQSVGKSIEAGSNAIKKSYLGLSGNRDPPLATDPDIIIDPKQGISIYKKEQARETLYQDCSEEDVAYAVACLCSESIALSATPLQLTQDRFGRVPRVYIETLQDRQVQRELQKKMYTAQPCQKIFSLTAGHSPFFSVPEEFVAILTSSEVLRDCVERWQRDEREE